MNLLELSKNLKRNLRIEYRPAGEYIVSFGEDCTLIEQSPDGKHRKKVPSVHGRGQSLKDAVHNFVLRMSNENALDRRLFYLRFPANFDNHGDVLVDGLVHEPDLIK